MTRDKREKREFNEMELPETLYVRDIDDKVFQAIALQVLSSIEGVVIFGGNFIDHLFNRSSNENFKKVHITQDNKKHSVTVKVELGILYGISIPEKSEEVQGRITEEITAQTGLHVSCVHVVFRSVLLPSEKKIDREKQIASTEHNPIAKKTESI